MNLDEVMTLLKEKGTEQTKKIYRNHGAPENFDGVKVADMKIIQKKVKNDQKLALELFATNHGDAQYLAGLIADPKAFTKEELRNWAENGTWYMVSEYAVAWNLAESLYCIELSKEWIDSDNPKLQQVAWAALASYLSVTPNDEIDISFHEKLIDRIVKDLHSSANRVRYVMNGYLIALGSAIPELTEKCKRAGEEIGKVDVQMGNTACKVPDIKTYIEKVEQRGSVGKKKKTCKC